MPMFVYNIERMKPKIRMPKEEDVEFFITKIFNKMKLAFECTIVLLIYLEKVMDKG